MQRNPKNKATPNVSTSSTQKKMFQFPLIQFPSHPRTEETASPWKNCQPKKVADQKKMHQTKKTHPFFFVTRKLPRVGFVGSFSSPSPSSRDQRIQSNLIRSTGLSQLLGWKKPIPVESYDYLLLLKPDFFWVEKSRTIKKQLIRFGGLHIYIYILFEVHFREGVLKWSNMSNYFRH